MPMNRRVAILSVVTCLGSAFVALGVIYFGIRTIENGRWTVPESEHLVAQRIRTLGGVFDKHGGVFHHFRQQGDEERFGHISSVVLRGTAATDEDIRGILQLRFLVWLDVRDTAVTDASVDAIVGREYIRTFTAFTRGSNISFEGRERLLRTFSEMDKPIVMDD